MSSFIAIFLNKTVEWFDNKSLLFYCFIITLFFSSSLLSQEINSRNERIIELKCQDTILIFEETIIPGTVQLEYDTNSFELSYQLINNNIVLDCSDNNSENKPIYIKFRSLPYPFHKRITLWDSSQIQVVEGDIFYNPVEQKKQSGNN